MSTENHTPPSTLDDCATPIGRGERRLLLAVVWIAAVTTVCGITVADPDLWGHTLYGLRAIEQGVLTETADPFSYTAPGSRWVNHEWLTEYLFGWIWQNLGDVGLWWWRNFIVIGLFAIAAAVLFRARAGVAAGVVLLAYSALCLGTFCALVRPQLGTFLLFGLTLALLRSYWERPHRWIWLLPPVTALWVNLHGGFLAGVAIQVLFLAAFACRMFLNRDAFSKRFRRSGRAATATVDVADSSAERSMPCIELRTLVMLALVVCASLAATLINPYGAEMHTMLFDHLVPKQAVREWQPLWTTVYAPAFYIPFVLLAVALIGSRRWQWIDLLVIACITYQAVSHIRHVALLSIALLVLLPVPLTDAISRMFPSLIKRFSFPRAKWTRSMFVAAVVVLLVVPRMPSARNIWMHGIRPWQIAVSARGGSPGMPVRAVSWMEGVDLHGNLITDYAWGQYVLWHLYPRTRVAFDGRYRTIYPVDLEDEFLAFLATDARGPSRLALLDKYNSELVLLPRSITACDYMATRDDWFRCYQDDQAVLFVRDVPKFRGFKSRDLSSATANQGQAAWNRFPAGPRGVPTGTRLPSHRSQAARDVLSLQES